MRGIVLLGIAIAAFAAPPAGAFEVDGDLILWLRNQDFEGDRTGFELSWLSPPFAGLRLETGGGYQHFDQVGWGYGILGGVYAFDDANYYLSTRLKQGSGDAPGTSFNYTDWRSGLSRVLLSRRLVLKGEFQLIRVDALEYNLAHVGFQVFPHRSVGVAASYFHHIAGDSTNGVSTRLDYHTTLASLFAGYAWSSADTDVLRSGNLTTQAQHTHEYYLGLSRPWGRHTPSLVGTRRHVGGEVFHTIDLVWRFSLAPPPPRSDLKQD